MHDNQVGDKTAKYMYTISKSQEVLQHSVDEMSRNYWNNSKSTQSKVFEHDFSKKQSRKRKEKYTSLPFSVETLYMEWILLSSGGMLHMIEFGKPNNLSILLYCLTAFNHCLCSVVDGLIN